MTEDDQDLLPPGAVIDGRYVVEALIGRGGMAAVYCVRHVHLDTQHALKVLTVGGPSLARRLQQEGRVQATLQHPNIVAVTDMVSVDGQPGLVMEFVRGPSLEALLGKKADIELLPPQPTEMPETCADLTRMMRHLVNVIPGQLLPQRTAAE